MQNATKPPPNKGMQRTVLCARKILAFLKAGIGPSVVPIYRCIAADAQAVGPQQRRRRNTPVRRYHDLL
jgi:hypothetical protein